ncbi:hypothetical protein BSL78_08633 [Apostichopus japonicus]|uniref:Uncharacterized protein n=1 Tax=Stichopus japonicus TaxID=307972 RepID=A0A2G8L2Q2_STIJA|nr:hypothetical protein BSL78_08633 [Apostichopus japonicus]
MALRGQIKPKHNADQFLNERNVQQKSLERAMRGLTVERNYIMKHMDMDKKFFKTRCDKFQADVAKIKKRRPATQLSPKHSASQEPETNIREVKVKIIEPTEENQQLQSSVPKLPSASKPKELKPAIKLSRSQSVADLDGLSNTLPAIRGKSQPAVTALGARRNTIAVRSTTADPLNWSYSSGMFSCHNLRTSRIDFGFLDKAASVAAKKEKDDYEREELQRMLKDETELNKVMIKRRKQSLFQKVDETIALTKPTPARLTPCKSPVGSEGDNEEFLTVQQSERPESTADSFSEDLEQLRDTIRFQKMQRWKNRDRRRSSVVTNLGKKDDETDEQYEDRLSNLKKEMKNCRYLRRRDSQNVGLGTETLVANQRKAEQIWRQSLAHNLF